MKKQSRSFKERVDNLNFFGTLSQTQGDRYLNFFLTRRYMSESPSLAERMWISSVNTVLGTFGLIVIFVFGLFSVFVLFATPLALASYFVMRGVNLPLEWCKLIAQSAYILGMFMGAMFLYNLDEN